MRDDSLVVLFTGGAQTTHHPSISTSSASLSTHAFPFPADPRFDRFLGLRKGGELLSESASRVGDVQMIGKTWKRLQKRVPLSMSVETRWESTWPVDSAPARELEAPADVRPARSSASRAALRRDSRML